MGTERAAGAGRHLRAIPILTDRAIARDQWMKEGRIADVAAPWNRSRPRRGPRPTGGGATEGE